SCAKTTSYTDSSSPGRASCEQETQNPEFAWRFHSRSSVSAFVDFVRGNSSGRATNRLLPQCMIAKHQRGHRFDYRNCARKNARIVAAAGGELTFLFGTGDGLLLKGHCGGRLKRNAKINVFAVADSTLHAAGVVCCRPYFSTAHFKWIVVLRTAHSRRRKSGANLECFC